MIEDGTPVVYRVPGHSGLRSGIVLGTVETFLIVKDVTDGSHWKIPFEFAIPTTKEGIKTMHESRLAHDIRVATSKAFVDAHFWTFVKAHYDDTEVWRASREAAFLNEADPAPNA